MLKITEKPHGRLVLELIRIVLQREAPAIEPLDHEEIQVVDSSRRQRRHVDQREIRVPRILDEGLLKNEIHRNGGRIGLAEFALDHSEQMLDRNVTILEGLFGGLANAVDDVHKARITAQIIA